MIGTMLNCVGQGDLLLKDKNKRPTIVCIKTKIIPVILLSLTVSGSAFGTESLLNKARVSISTSPECHSTNVDSDQWTVDAFSVMPGQSYCLRVKIDTGKRDLPDNPALVWSAMAASEIYWDGVYLTSNGEPASRQAGEIPGTIEYLYPLDRHLLKPGTHTLSIWFSNHYQRHEMHQNIYHLNLVDYRLYQRQLVKDYLPSIFLSGALIFIAFVLALIYGLYRREGVTAWLVILSLTCALLLWAESWRSLFGYAYNWHTFRLNVVLCLAFVIAVSLTGYYLKLYSQPRRWAWWVLSITLYVVVAFSPLSYDFKVWLLFLLAILLSLTVCLAATLTKSPGAKIALTFLLITTLLFIFLNMRFVEHWFAVVFGGLVLFNLYQLIQRFSRDRARSLEADKLEAELLRRCLQPHFLMNSLTLIMEWIDTDPEKANSFISSLSREFQLLTEYSRKAIIPLENELLLCKNYLNIMSTRLQCNYKLQVRGNTGSIKLPPAIIHTLIENAFSHGNLKADTFVLTITHRAGWIYLDLLCPYGNSHRKGLGIGMRYIKAQLARSYGEYWRIDSYKHQGQWKTSIKFKEKS